MTGTEIWMIDVIDMTLEYPDVIGTVHIVAANQVEAAQRAMQFLDGQKVITPDKKYHVNAVRIGLMPNTGKTIIAPSSAEAQAILKSGEIALPRR